MSTIQQMKALVSTIEKEAEAFTIKGNSAAGTRARMAAQELKGLCQDLRTQIQETKNAKK
jgi:hypothetical protein